MHKCKECLFICSKLTAVVFGGKNSTSEDTLGFGAGVKLGVPEGKGFYPYYYFTLFCHLKIVPRKALYRYSRTPTSEIFTGKNKEWPAAEAGRGTLGGSLNLR